MMYFANVRRTTAASIVFCAAVSAAAEHAVPYFPSASDPLERQGFARIINHSAEAGHVRIVAFDDAGTEHGPLTLSIGAGAAQHINSQDLEQGNPGKGLTGSTGPPGSGAWRLELDSARDIEVLAYVRTPDGFLTAMHDAAPQAGDRHDLPFFNPGSNVDQQSLLRLVNPGAAAAEATMTGFDERGIPSRSVTATVSARGSSTYTAAELESGGAPGLNGNLGTFRVGKWRLTVTSDAPIIAMSLLSSPTGHITNLSTLLDPELVGEAVGGDTNHVVPLFPSASDPHGRQGFARVINRSNDAAGVEVKATDQTNHPFFPTVVFVLGPRQALNFNSDDLEFGSTKFVNGSTGAGLGDWRLTLSSALDLQVLAYIRTTDGFVTAMHDIAPQSVRRHRIPIFNPGSNTNQRSLLRLINQSEEAATAAIVGTDGAGRRPGPGVRVYVPADGTRTLSAQALERGGPGFEGALGDGVGKWRLTVTANRPIIAMNLLASPGGYLTNLSTAPSRGAGPPETAAEALEGSVWPVVQSKCVGCHVDGGDAGFTRLVFTTDEDPDHIVENLEVFDGYLEAVENGAANLLGMIGGELDHPGEVLVPADSNEYAGFEQLLELLRRGDMTIAGTAYQDASGSVPLAGADCEFAALAESRLGPGEPLAAATAGDDGAFRMVVPSDTDGHLVCWPAELPKVGLMAFAGTGKVGSTQDVAVSLLSTVAVMALTTEAARVPDRDLRYRWALIGSTMDDNPDLDLLADAAAGAFAVLRERSANVPFFELLVDALGNGRIDDPTLTADLSAALDTALAGAEQRAGARIFRAATRTFSDFLALADAKGVAEPAPRPPIAADAPSLAAQASDLRTAEFANNPSLYFMNAHWAYARGLTGAGEVTAITDTGIYAAHQEFAGRLHDETTYTVLRDDETYPEFHKVGDKDPSTAYPTVTPDTSECEGIYCKFYLYEHGSLMASVAVGARNGVDAHGVAFDNRLVFRPYRQHGTNTGACHYHLPDQIHREITSWHQIVRQSGDLAAVVSNSWLSGTSEFHASGPSDAADCASAYPQPFHKVLTPRYVRYQRDRQATRQALMVWSAGNRPNPGGPIVDGAAVPGVSERQLRALSGGERGLADLLLTNEERASLSDAEALDRAQRVLDVLKRRWLAVVAVGDYTESGISYEALMAKFAQHSACVASDSPGDCDLNYTMAASARCGFASDWCVAAGPTWGGVSLDIKQPPQPTGSFAQDAYRTSEATAAAGGALAILLQAYRDADGRLSVGTNTVLKRLKATARRDIFDPETRLDWDSSNVLLREEELIRSLMLYAGASDDDLRDLMDTARRELNDEDIDGDRVAGTTKDDRMRMLNRLVPYYTVIQEDLIKEMLDATAANSARAAAVLAELIRQVEWIDEQLKRLGRTKDTATDDDVRRIAITSLIGHGMIDLKAATDPAR